MYPPEVLASHEATTDFHFMPTDKEWLEQLGYSWSESEEEASLDYLENLVYIASTPPNPYSDKPTDNMQAVIARTEFIERLTNLDEDTKQNLITHPNWILSLSSVIGTQRILHNLGIDNLRIIRNYPALLSFEPNLMQSKLDNLTNHGFNTQRLVKHYSPILGLSSEELSFRISGINSLNLKATKVINVFPQILDMPRATIKDRLDNLRAQGLDEHKIVHSEPYVLRFQPEVIIAKVRFLKKLGLDAPRIINKFPTTLNYSFSTLKLKFDNLGDLGLDAVYCLNYSPYIFGVAPETVRERFENLRSSGLDASAVVNGNPNIFNKTVSSINDRLSNLTALGLDALKIVNVQPSVLNPTPETIIKKLRVLHSAARAWGLKDYKEPVNRFIESYPALLGYSADRNRVLVRILNNSLKPHSRLTLNQIRLLTVNNLEATLAGYLKLEKRPLSPEQISAQSKILYSLGSRALKDIILSPEHTNDQAVKFYRRSVARKVGVVTGQKYYIS